MRAELVSFLLAMRPSAFFSSLLETRVPVDPDDPFPQLSVRDVFDRQTSLLMIAKSKFPH